MNVEQFDKIYNLLTSMVIGIWFIFLFGFLSFGIYLIHVYYDDKEKKDEKDIVKREKELRDKCYLSDLEHRIRILEDKQSKD